MRGILGVVAATALFAPVGAATAASVQTDITLQIAIEGLAPITIATNGMVDVTGDTVTLDPGVVDLASPISVPVTSTTAVHALTVTRLANLAGTFSLGGVTNWNFAELCPPMTGPGRGEACNRGGGMGGFMGLTGTINVVLEPPDLGVTIPIDLNLAGIGRGGVGMDRYVTDNALWSSGLGIVNTGDANFFSSGTNQAPDPGITLVTPTFLDFEGSLGPQPIFTHLTLSNVAVPEPRALLLAASGVATLLLLRRLRAR